jgi:hypothetical protein
MRIGRREFGFGRRQGLGGGLRQRPRWGGGARDFDGPVRSRGRGFAWVPILLLVWLIIGAIAAGQRGYFTDAAANCATFTTTVVTIVAGPLNYVGVNPTIDDCKVNLPQPSP